MDKNKTKQTVGALPEKARDSQLIAWLDQRLERSLPLDEHQRAQLINLLCSLRAL